MGELVSFEGEPPAEIAADTVGLPPKRARLAKFLAWRRREADALATLEAGQKKLASRIERAEAAAAKRAAEVEADAVGVVDAIRRGAEYALTFVRAKADALPDLSVARAARAKLGAEIEAKREHVATIAAHVVQAADGAAIEEAKRVAADYRNALDAACDAMTRLEALEVALGRSRVGRLAGEMPGFPLAGHELDVTAVAAAPSEVETAAEIWRDLRRVWIDNPRVDAAKVLHFGKHDPAKLEDVVYHELTRAERRLVDAKAVNSKL